MKIGFDAKRYYHNRTGIGNFSRCIIEGLKSMHPHDEFVLYDEKPFVRTFGLGAKARRDGCTLFHGLSNELPFDVRRQGMRSLLTMHDVAYLTFTPMYNWADRQIYNYKYGNSCRIADHIHAISESTKNDVIRYYDIPEEKITVIYQPVSELFYSPLSPTEADHILSKAVASGMLSGPLPKDYILNVGTINSRKNLLGLVRGLEMIPASQRPMLIVVGDGHSYRREVERYVLSHRLTQFVRIESGVTDNRVLQALYSQALLMAYPSFYEGFGLPVVEAVLQRCPVLTSNVSSLPEAVGPDALLCAPGDVDSIHDGLCRLLDDPLYALHLSGLAEDYVRARFEPHRLINQIYELYLFLLQ